ncbi:MAG: YibE/F family protein [Spirochaetales bacterium]|nr:YibE/F family protein [Spirochaetales bacterium]
MKKLQNISVKLHENTFKRFFVFSILVFCIIIPIVSVNLFKSFNYVKSSFVYGEVTEVLSSNLESDPYVPGRKLGKQEFIVKILNGIYKNNLFTVSNTLSKGHNIEVVQGKHYIFSIRTDSNSGIIVWLYSYNRLPVLLVLLILFIILVILIGRRKGFNSLIALYFTGVLLLFILVPLILKGYNPIVFSILILSIITCISFILISGLTKKTLISIIGTLGGIIAAGIISYVSSKIAFLSGINMEKGEQILYIAEDYGIRVNGFLFIAILISSLGAVMDVAMGITSSMDEIMRHHPLISKKELFNSGMAIGRDLIGTMINTLILAFTGGSFTLILMIAGLNMDFLQLINIPIISIEIIQGIAGSIGIILTVPLTNIVFIIINKEKIKDEKQII